MHISNHIHTYGNQEINHCCVFTTPKCFGSSFLDWPVNKTPQGQIHVPSKGPSPIHVHSLTNLTIHHLFMLWSLSSVDYTSNWWVNSQPTPFLHSFGELSHLNPEILGSLNLNLAVWNSHSCQFYDVYIYIYKFYTCCICLKPFNYP